LNSLWWGRPERSFNFSNHNSIFTRDACIKGGGLWFCNNFSALYRHLINPIYKFKDLHEYILATWTDASSSAWFRHNLPNLGSAVFHLRALYIVVDITGVAIQFRDNLGRFQLLRFQLMPLPYGRK
jgi:hypothetical protein